MSVDVNGLAPLVEGAAALGLTLSDEQVARFAQLRDLLLDWNTRVNLTAITDPAEVVTRHFLDALTCVLALSTQERARPLRLLDVGSGAGFPGLPLAIAFPRWQVTMLEATGKKTRFQEAAIAALGLTNAHALNGRAEELAHAMPQRGRYDVVTARALATLPTLLEYCAPFARVGGIIIAPKKGDLEQEVVAGARAATMLGAQLQASIPITTPRLEAEGRALLVARQQRPCPSQYPRAGGAPQKRPLGS
ncbi:MAG TPA: 16S rRNA (guanine(527)-N(7))-methyltransferase RsmG [Ktedonobacterales bacterium]|nr:16S rRNA (guanine(527)-N(7))-methyltransferase RsmG [Ktedonobacterales bacterium]